MTKNEKKPAEIGRADGAKWAHKHRAASPLQAAHACGFWHMKRAEKGTVKVSDVVEYGQAFVNAALAELEKAQAKPAKTAYRREPHAAHYGNHPGHGHDLEWWDAVQAWTDPRPADVPSDAEKHSGYLDAERRQHVLFCRAAPLSGPPCSRCPSPRQVAP